MFARGTRIEENRALRRYGMGWLVEHVGATLGATFESGRDAQQSAAQSAQQTARDTQRKTAEETARVIETTAPKNGSIPIADYDEKTVGEITSRLDALSDEQLRRVKDYERRTKNRETLLQQIERRIQRAS